jgi:hypothetical protein
MHTCTHAQCAHVHMHTYTHSHLHTCTLACTDRRRGPADEEGGEMSRRLTGPEGSGSLPRADTLGESRVVASRPATLEGRSAAATPRQLLTENGNHLLPGAAWRFDTAVG